MAEHEFIAKTLEVDWLAPVFRGVHLSGDFLIDGTKRIPGEAVLSLKGMNEPAPESTGATFTGGPSPKLSVHFAHTGPVDTNLFREVVFNPWTGFSIVFAQSPLDPNSTVETFVEFKKVRFSRKF
ncbi:MAG: hypothetical protein WCE79_04000 [Xanthobacteraceae bacterium]